MPYLIRALSIFDECLRACSSGLRQLFACLRLLTRMAAVVVAMVGLSNSGDGLVGKAIADKYGGPTHGARALVNPSS